MGHRAISCSRANTMGNQEVLHYRGKVLVRRQRLFPGGATPWHRDPYNRLTVVLSGDFLSFAMAERLWCPGSHPAKWIGPSQAIASTAL